MDIACVHCRAVVGYHVVKPCHGCLSADNNGHYWMMHGNAVKAVYVSMPDHSHTR